MLTPEHLLKIKENSEKLITAMDELTRLVKIQVDLDEDYADELDTIIEEKSDPELTSISIRLEISAEKLAEELM